MANRATGWTTNEKNSSSFDGFVKDFIPSLIGIMNEVAHQGSELIGTDWHGIMGYDVQPWKDDTGSLRSAWTGYGAGQVYADPGYDKGGDYSTNALMEAINRPEWEMARIEGSERYKFNTPEHYQPSVHEESFSVPTGIITIFIGYPKEGVEEDSELLQLVSAEMIKDAEWAVENVLPVAVEKFINKGYVANNSSGAMYGNEAYRRYSLSEKV